VAPFRHWPEESKISKITSTDSAKKTPRDWPGSIRGLDWGSHQLGHAKPTTTLQHYAHWLPRGSKTYIDRLPWLGRLMSQVVTS